MSDALAMTEPASEAFGAFSPIVELRREAFAVLAPPPKIALADWIESNICLPSDVSHAPGPMRLFSYQRGICEAVDDPAITRVSFVKPVRVGATALITGIVGAYVQNDPCNILAVQPTLDDARDYVVSTLEPTFAASPSLRGLLTQKKAKRDQITSRRYPGGSFKCVAAVPRMLRRHTIRVALLDEIDAYEPSPEGSPIKLAEKRTLSFSNRLIFMASTPTMAETSNILKAYAESDQRIFEIPCPDCGDFNEPRWENIKWESGKPETAYYVCPHCGSCVDEKHKPAMVAAGRWRAKREHVKGHAGFRCSALISTLDNAAWGVLAAEFLASKDDPDLLRVFVNTILAEPFVDRAGEGLDEHALAKRAEPIGLNAIPSDVRLLTAGVDVQQYGLEIVTLGHSESQMFALAYETIHGPPTSDETWRELDALLKRRFQHPLGGTLGYDAAAVDSGDGNVTDIVYKFTRPRFAKRIVAVKGYDGERYLIERASKPGLYIVGADTGKARVFGLLEAHTQHIRFSADLPPRFYEELASERRIVFHKAGQPRKRWERIKGARAEALDAFIYAMAVRGLVQVDLTRRFNELTQIITAKPKIGVAKSKWMQGERG
ncbi:phage terminase large subunit family protein [Terricaulis sp.]|uniref:phage terminase large subunit family protein n=1 Tax=Terricaulis sp. TaxID=2768686 RepID=UPI0037834A3C